jgi:hypothetical protein
VCVLTGLARECLCTVYFQGCTLFDYCFFEALLWFACSVRVWHASTSDALQLSACVHCRLAVPLHCETYVNVHGLRTVSALWPCLFDRSHIVSYCLRASQIDSQLHFGQRACIISEVLNGRMLGLLATMNYKSPGLLYQQAKISELLPVSLFAINVARQLAAHTTSKCRTALLLDLAGILSAL